jgi:hypothetical protein
MGSVSFPDRFELLDLLRENGVQTFRARERASGRAVEAHFFPSEAGMLARLDDLSQQRRAVIDHGNHDRGFYIVTESATESMGALGAAGAWRIQPAAQPKASAPPESPGTVPGDFTRMFQLRQAPEPVATPVSNSPKSKPVQAGEFTRVFQRPAAAAPAPPAGSSVPGQPGEFTRMFQQPARPAPNPAEAAPPVPDASDNAVPAPSAPASQPRGVFIAIAIVLLSAIAVFIWMRRLY